MKNDKKEKPIIQAEEVKKWTGDMVHAVKNTINEVIDNIKEGTDDFEQKQLKAKREKDLRLLKPVFKEMLEQITSASGISYVNGFKMPAIIHVVEKDKKHKDSEACKHSFGHISTENGIKVLNVYPHHMKDLGVFFFPNMEKEFYYVDPCHKNLYIDMQEYFSQLKIARVNELEQLAYSLGAKHFEIIFKSDVIEQKKTNKKAELGAKRGNKKLFDIKAEHRGSEVKRESIEVERKMDLSGHDDPQVPKLVYFQNDPDIQNLIFMRCDNKSYLKNKECKIKYSNSSGINESDAAKIQGALDKMGGGTVGTTIMNEALNESCTTLIYRIEF